MKKKSQMHTSREIVNLIAKFIIEYSIRKCMACLMGIKKVVGETNLLEEFTRSRYVHWYRSEYLRYRY